MTLATERVEPKWKTGDGRFLKPSEMTDIHVLYAFRWYQRHCDRMFNNIDTFHSWGRIFLAEINSRGLKPLPVEDPLAQDEYYTDGWISIEKVLTIYKQNPRRVIEAAKRDTLVYQALLEITKGKIS